MTKIWDQLSEIVSVVRNEESLGDDNRVFLVSCFCPHLIPWASLAIALVWEQGILDGWPSNTIELLSRKSPRNPRDREPFTRFVVHCGWWTRLGCPPRVGVVSS